MQTVDPRLPGTDPLVWQFCIGPAPADVGRHSGICAAALSAVAGRGRIARLAIVQFRFALALESRTHKNHTTGPLNACEVSGYRGADAGGVRLLVRGRVTVCPCQWTRNLCLSTNLSSTIYLEAVIG
ncbi:hypothetical protein EVAR_31509_1 [Eumeta japonica]|uniref:Uncharacterized protein n=1 Tax=Eumeta variegata TaxID=151549 RepID=A0A4C1Z3H2_EUMVA|nr:hypothetical protein EVAR_31509_1 [Eumeta japonica]